MKKDVKKPLSKPLASKPITTTPAPQEPQQTTSKPVTTKEELASIGSKAGLVNQGNNHTLQHFVEFMWLRFVNKPNVLVTPAFVKEWAVKFNEGKALVGADGETAYNFNETLAQTQRII
jgi:hypothetical protein